MTLEDVTTRGNYYPDKSMATAAVSSELFSGVLLLITSQNPPLYLHVTSTSKLGLEQAVQKIEELMKQELPNLVDERRFRRREPDQVERDEFGRVSSIHHRGIIANNASANGPRRRFQLSLSLFRDSIFVHKLLVMEVHT